MPANNTVVNSDSTWSLDIPSSRFDEGPVTPDFRYVGSDYSSGVQISVGAADDGISSLMIGIISIVILALLGAVFVYFFVEIEDDGDGFSRDVLDKLGEPYISKNKKGMGLGIFIAKNLIENMKGNIIFYNSTNNGAVVEIIFDKTILI